MTVADTKPRSNLVLVGECPPGTRVRFTLSSVKMTVGRHGDVVLREPSVSRDHAVLTWNGDVWKVTDLGSRNGTFVNGVSVQRKFVVPGDLIKFGRVALSLIDPESEGFDDSETFAPTMVTAAMTAADALGGGGGRPCRRGRASARRTLRAA